MNKENQARIIELVKQAKPLILQEMAHEKVTEKGVADYVTNVDVAVQNYLKEALEKEFPEIRLIAEEKENLGLNSRKSYWILDPIDGTTNLIRDYHLSAVSLGLMKMGKSLSEWSITPLQRSSSTVPKEKVPI